VDFPNQHISPARADWLAAAQHDLTQKTLVIVSPVAIAVASGVGFIQCRGQQDPRRSSITQHTLQQAQVARKLLDYMQVYGYMHP
jgi:hypothetical protein